MAERGLKASTEGIAKANQALIRNNLNKTALARDLGLSRATVTNFFRVIPIDRLNFEEICKRLGLNWQEIVDIPVCKSQTEEHQNTTSKTFDFLGREDAIKYQLLKEEIDKMFASELDIQQLLKFVSCKSRQIKAESYTEHKLSAIRAYYLHLYSNSGIDLYLAFSLDSSIKYNPSLMLDLNLAKTLSCFYDFPRSLSHASYIADFLELAIKQLAHNKINLQQSQKDQLLSELRELRQQLPSELELVPSSPNTKNDEDRTRFEKFIGWWQNEGQNWAGELRTVMIAYRGISQDFWLLDKQKLIVLHRYYSFNKLLVDFLRNTSDNIRSHIEDTLLLPIAEIEKRPFKN
ncbi:hypothetical protein PQG02_30635 [Nostoc sp. UHCC 0926]|nr:hypothetical protein [Nostoc sp. UHCC 0926]WDD32905.1 hypothetical protein PQG02_30635 [Nostoc sp. UHCC 0926]